MKDINEQLSNFYLEIQNDQDRSQFRRQIFEFIEEAMAKDINHMQNQINELKNHIIEKKFETNNKIDNRLLVEKKEQYNKAASLRDHLISLIRTLEELSRKQSASEKSVSIKSASLLIKSIGEDLIKLSLAYENEIPELKISESRTKNKNEAQSDKNISDHEPQESLLDILEKVDDNGG